MLILIGLIFLAINLGKLSWWIWADLLRLWPVFLIAVGLELIVKKSKVQYLGYLSTLLIIAAFVWVILDAGGVRNDDDGYGVFPSSRSEATVDYKNEISTLVKVEFENGRIYFNTDDTYLIRAVAENSRRGLKLESDCSAPRCVVNLSQSGHSFSLFDEFHSDNNHWKCYVYPDVGVTYDLKLTDADLRFFAQTLKVDSLRIDADHSDLQIKLGIRQTRTHLDVSGRNSDLDIYFPDSVGIRLEGTYPSPTERDELKLTDRGGYLANDLYDKAAVNVQIKSSLDKGKIRLSAY